MWVHAQLLSYLVQTDGQTVLNRVELFVSERILVYLRTSLNCTVYTALIVRVYLNYEMWKDMKENVCNSSLFGNNLSFVMFLPKMIA
jgi:hypothetical protein